MALLTANSDDLRYDKLRSDGLTEVDMLGKQMSNRIRTYDKEYGFALHPEEKEQLVGYKKEVDSRAQGILGAKSKYDSQYTKAMAEADAKAKGLLAKAGAGGSQKTAKVRVVNGDVVEGTYTVNEDWLNQNLATLRGAKIANGLYNVDVRIDGHVQGKEIHALMTDAHKETQKLNSKLSAIKEKNVSAVKKTISSERGIAEKQHAQAISQYDQAAASVTGEYTRYIADQRARFQQGIASNDKGIANLLNSGALILKATVK